jgi:hypothetical protein
MEIYDRELLDRRFLRLERLPLLLYLNIININ